MDTTRYCNLRTRMVWHEWADCYKTTLLPNRMVKIICRHCQYLFRNLFNKTKHRLTSQRLFDCGEINFSGRRTGTGGPITGLAWFVLTPLDFLLWNGLASMVYATSRIIWNVSVCTPILPRTSIRGHVNGHHKHNSTTPCFRPSVIARETRPKRQIIQVSQIQMGFSELAHDDTNLNKPWIVESVFCKRTKLASMHI